MLRKQAVQKRVFDLPSHFELYLPQEPGPSPLICITPILGRLVLFQDLFLERRFACFFANHGFAAVLIDRPIFGFNSNLGLGQIHDYLEESVMRNKAVLDYLLTQKEIDPTKIATFGMSFGAVVNSLWAASDTRPKAHVFALAGGNLPEIFLSSRDPLMRSFFRAALASVGFDKKVLMASLEKIFQTDPLTAAPFITKENVLLCLALFDRVVPLRYGLAFRRVLGTPKTIFIPLGHYLSVLAVPLLKWNVLAFFKKKLADP